MADRGTVATRDANRPASAATSRCADRVIAVAGREAEALFWGGNNWTVVLGDKTLTSMGDSGCLSREAVGTHHKA